MGNLLSRSKHDLDITESEAETGVKVNEGANDELSQNSWKFVTKSVEADDGLVSCFQ
jgi:hypothetical protein